MKDETGRKVEAFWLRDLGLESGFPSVPVACTVQQLYNGVQMFLRGGRLVVAIPPEKHGHIRDSVGDLSPDELFSVEWLQGALGQDVEKIRGPADLFYADETNFRFGEIRQARALSPADLPACVELQASLDAKELEDSGFEAGKSPAFGVFSGNVLGAVASYSIWEPSIAHINVATHRDYRRQGFATAAVRALARDALSRGLVLQWQTVVWNTNSTALARQLGFEHYSRKLFARCRHKSDDAPVPGMRERPGET